MHYSDARSGTVPVSGMQYASSPSLPSAVKALGQGRGGEAVRRHAPLTGPLPQSTLELYDRYYASLPGTEAAATAGAGVGGTSAHTASRAGHADDGASLTLPDALASIGPSARRLLLLDEMQRRDAAPHEPLAEAQDNAASGQAGGRGAPTAYSSHPHASRATAPQPTASTTARHPQQQRRPQEDYQAPVVAAAAKTLPIYTGKLKTKNATRSRGNGASASLPPPLSHPTTGAHPSPAGAPADVRPPLLSSTITQGSLSGTRSRTAAADAAAAPPLATQLHAFVQRELLRGMAGGVAAASAMEQLGPYREAFRALGSAFPAYASLMSDIQSAYDNVIQAQAELLAEAYAAAAAREVEGVSRQEEVLTLHTQMRDLQQELKSMEDALESRATAEAEQRQQAAGQRPRSGQLADAKELRRELDSAHQRIGDLERSSQSDLEKIVILIGAVRECDRRLKEYERIVVGVTGQVSELDEFKRIAGEAQAELQLFRKKYADYVPVTDFQLMKEYLATELESAQLLTRRWRRTAAVRGTQLDIMQRRLTMLEEDRAALTKALESAEGSAAGRGPLTPRPAWAKLHAQLPELAEHAADVGQLTTASDRLSDAASSVTPVAAPSAVVAPPTAAPAVPAEGQGDGAATAPPRTRPVPVVKGLRETSLQVEYLVHRVATLERQLLDHKQQQQQLAQLRQQVLEQVGRKASVPSSEGKQVVAGREGSAGSSASTAEARVDRALASPVLPQVSTRRGQHRRSDGQQSSPTGTHSAFTAALASAGGVSGPQLAPPLELPLVGLGYGAEVPVYLRASGVVPRRPVPPATILSLVYHFFLDVLPPYLDQHDQLQGSDAFDGGSGADRDRIGHCLCDYLQSEMASREDLKHYEAVSYLVLNLMRDGDSREWFSDALHVLLWTVQGLLPPRVAVDAAVVVAQVKRDLRGLAKELQTSRLRRQAVSECLQPVLELKTASEVAELRATLSGETTFGVDNLCSESHPFMQVLLVQECRASAELYVAFLAALSARATTMASRGGSATARTAGNPAHASAASFPKAGPAAVAGVRLEEGDRVLSLADVAAAIQEVEPQTPGIVVRELSLNAVTAAGKQDLFGDPATAPHAVRSGGGGGGAGNGGAGGDASSVTKAHSAEEACIVVRLSDIVRAIGAAPLIRRTLQNTPENCML